MNAPKPVVAGSPGCSGLAPAYTVLKSAGKSVPGWLPELAEAIAGKRLNADNAEVEVPASAFLALQARLAALPATNDWNRWARWFVADPGQRPRTPQP